VASTDDEDAAAIFVDADTDVSEVASAARVESLMCFGSTMMDVFPDTAAAFMLTASEAATDVMEDTWMEPI
jgi:hypothetical protein